ncbi:Patched domain-containing protein [Cymbomonas tetramitiformis]|uniref:Patched domain-containing protein n=1 Tax=Cymbomonas tetramitiformis TaxID=36881 RepID=A0AAE0BTX3_9CHLO|nr:Patched domain-containing protein [Cymbomonas tetramitiformis]
MAETSANGVELTTLEDANPLAPLAMKPKSSVDSFQDDMQTQTPGTSEENTGGGPATAVPVNDDSPKVSTPPLSAPDAKRGQGMINGNPLFEATAAEDAREGGEERLPSPENPVDTPHLEAPIPFVNLIPKKPCTAFGIFCCGWFLTFVVGGSLFATGAVVLSTDTPFYNRGDLTQSQEDAFTQASIFASSIHAASDSSSYGCVHSDETSLAYDGTLAKGSYPSDACQRSQQLEMNILYLRKDVTDNIFTADILAKIQEMEMYMRNEEDYAKHCQLVDTNIYVSEEERETFDSIPDEDRAAHIEAWAVNTTHGNYTACRTPTSGMYLFDKMYFDLYMDSGYGYYMADADTVYMKPTTDSDEWRDHVTQYWANYTSKSYDLSKYHLHQYSDIDDEIYVTNLLSPVATNGFEGGSGRAYGLLSTFYWALPLDGYEDQSDDRSDQLAKLGAYLYHAFHSELGGMNIAGVEVYWGDTAKQMMLIEIGVVMNEAFTWLAIAILFVYLYLILMLDSVFLASMGMGQILLAFFPSLLLYKFVLQQNYFGTLNVIAVFIIIGVGVDDIFVFNDDWTNNSHIYQDSSRFSHTWKRSAKAMLTTSLTTIFSFFSNSTSVFPAISTFGYFAAMMILVNYSAVITFYPSCVMVHHTIIKRKYPMDAPSNLFAKMRRRPQPSSPRNTPEAEEESEGSPAEKKLEGLVGFFHHTWAPIVIKWRHLILLCHLGLFVMFLLGAMEIQPAQDIPQILLESNQYRQYSSKLGQSFASADNPFQLQVEMVTGIHPDDPIDRAGTSPPDPDDMGDPRYVLCGQELDGYMGFDLTDPESQMWLLNVCHDAYFGNVTAYHNMSVGRGYDMYSKDGVYGPYEREACARVLDSEAGMPQTEDGYRTFVTCPMQGLRDWLLTRSGCQALQSYDLKCYNETRVNCTRVAGNASSTCEPFPLPQDSSMLVLGEWLSSSDRDPSSGATPMDKYGKYLYVQGCKTDSYTGSTEQEDCSKVTTCDHVIRQTTNSDGSATVPLWMRSQFKTVKDWKSLDYSAGLDLYDKWKEWMDEMNRHAPQYCNVTFQTSNSAWSFYNLNKSLIEETFFGIGLSLFCAFVVMASPLATSNVPMAFISTLTIAYIVLGVFWFTVAKGWDLGALEAINYVMVIGLSVDYCVHLSEAYIHAHSQDRKHRVRDMLTELGVSVVSGACSTLGCSFFMFFPGNEFYPKFGQFIFCTILLSIVHSLTFFPALLACIGPEGKNGNVFHAFDTVKHLVREVSGGKTCQDNF